MEVSVYTQLALKQGSVVERQTSWWSQGTRVKGQKGRTHLLPSLILYAENLSLGKCSPHISPMAVLDNEAVMNIGFKRLRDCRRLERDNQT